MNGRVTSPDGRQDHSAPPSSHAYQSALGQEQPPFPGQYSMQQQAHISNQYDFSSSGTDADAHDRVGPLSPHSTGASFLEQQQRNFYQPQNHTAPSSSPFGSSQSRARPFSPSGPLAPSHDSHAAYNQPPSLQHMRRYTSPALYADHPLPAQQTQHQSLNEIGRAGSLDALGTSELSFAAQQQLGATPTPPQQQVDPRRFQSQSSESTSSQRFGSFSAAASDSRALLHASILEYLQKQQFHEAATAFLRAAPDTQLDLLPTFPSSPQLLSNATSAFAKAQSEALANSELDASLYAAKAAAEGLSSPRDGTTTSEPTSASSSVVSHFGFTPNQNVASSATSPADSVHPGLPSTGGSKNGESFLYEWWSSFWEIYRTTNTSKNSPLTAANHALPRKSFDSSAQEAQFSSSLLGARQEASPLEQQSHQRNPLNESRGPPSLPGQQHNTTVFVGGLPACISEETLKSFFHHFGEITYCKIPTGKGCGFVQFVRRADAEMAIAKMNDFPIHGKSRIRLSWGRSQGDKQVEHVRKLASALGVQFDAVWRVVQGQDNTTIKQIATAVGAPPAPAGLGRLDQLGVGRVELGAVASAAGLTEAEVLDLVGDRSSMPQQAGNADRNWPSSPPNGSRSEAEIFARSPIITSSSLSMDTWGGGPYSRVSPSSFSAFPSAPPSRNLLPLSPPPSAGAFSHTSAMQQQQLHRPPQQSHQPPYNNSGRTDAYVVHSPNDFDNAPISPRGPRPYEQQQQHAAYRPSKDRGGYGQGQALASLDESFSHLNFGSRDQHSQAFASPSSPFFPSPTGFAQQQGYRSPPMNEEPLDQYAAGRARWGSYGSRDVQA